MLTQDYPRGTAASGPAPQKEDDSLKKSQCHFKYTCYRKLTIMYL